MGTQEDSKIDKILSIGTSLDFEDEVTSSIQGLEEDYTPGTRIHSIISSLKENKWKEYEVLIEIDKFKDSAYYMEQVFKNISKIFKFISSLGIESIGIQEFTGSYSDYYYLLIYIIK